MKKFIHQMEPWIDGNEACHMNAYLSSGGWLTEFQKTAEFEKMIADFTGSKYCVVVANGTVSMAVAYWAHGIEPGDEVLVPNLTMIATANAVRLVGGKPVLVDVEPRTLCMDIDRAQAALTSRTRAVAFVSLNGRAPEMKAWTKFCEKHGLFLLEDAAQSLGSRQAGRHLGTFGKIGSFSFSAPKIITTGQGGALVTDDEKIAERMRKIKDFGRVKPGVDWHDMMGQNFKFTDIQAVIGIEQMKKLPWRVRRKREMYKLYAEELGGLPGLEMLPVEPDNTPWFIDVYVPNPSEMRERLKARGIGSRQIYPPISKQAIYSGAASFPVSESFCERGLWLPSSSFLDDATIRQICAEFRDCFRSLKGPI
jgi:perosamine synthetase